MDVYLLLLLCFITLMKRPLNLYEIVDELQHTDTDDDLPSEITIFPPKNPNTDVTDEESGDEEFVALGSQLRDPAEIVYDDTFSDCEESENDLPLSMLAKRIRTADERLSEDVDQQIPSTSGSTPPTSYSLRYPTATPSVSKTQQYTWRNRHNR